MAKFPLSLPTNEAEFTDLLDDSSEAEVAVLAAHLCEITFRMPHTSEGKFTILRALALVAAPAVHYYRQAQPGMTREDFYEWFVYEIKYQENDFANWLKKHDH